MNHSLLSRLLLLAGLLLPAASLAAPSPRTMASPRRTLSLDGAWEIAEGSMAEPPAKFEHQVPVPGLVDMAKPAFAEVGTKSALREAFWYRRTFRVEGPVPAVALLKVHKACYGSRVLLNGTPLGEHLPSFTPGIYDARAALRGGGAENTLLIRVGAFRDAVPPSIPAGWDFEKKRYIPGIFDSVELVLTGTPRVVRVQAVPEIAKKSVRVQIVLRNDGDAVATPVRAVVRAVGVLGAAGRNSPAPTRPTPSTSSGGAAAGQAQSQPIRLAPGEEKTIELRVPLRNCRLWSPEEPFLYELSVSTGADELRTRFGMREFHFDAKTGRAMLNGRPYFLRGSNVCAYRFFEDAQRADRPWREDWVRRLHRRFKEMHWNALRYCIGFPPELWYRIADEEGILIQDEFPIWHGGNGWPPALKSDELVREYTEWMQERWNHPCVVIWDAQNESVTQVTGPAIAAVRALDLSNRPWDNGWGSPQAPTDVFESHPYLFSNAGYRLANLARQSGVPGGNPVRNETKNPIIINEYGWLWLNRDGSPTTLTRRQYQNLLGEDATPAERRHLYARYLAALTEFWRGHRACAGVLHFCGLGYSRPDGQTSDHFTDLETLTYEPEFLRFVSDAFAPVGLMLDFWAEELPPGSTRDFPVVVINDLYDDWKGSLRLRLVREGKTLQERSQPCAVKALDSASLRFSLDVPAEPGRYTAIAELIRPGEEPVASLRDFEVLTPEARQAREGIAVGKPVLASSSLNRDGATSAAEAVDGKTDTRWSSEFSDPQWLAVDLGKEEMISRVQLLWEAAFARAYTVEVSPDGKSWREVYRTDKGGGGTEDIRFSPTPARWVRLHGTRRATEYGYSLWEMRVFH